MNPTRPESNMDNNSIENTLRRTSISVASLQANLLPSAPDLSVRKSISDSVLSRGKPQPQSYDNKNTLFMMVSRSGVPVVKRILLRIVAACIAQESGQPHVTAPERELFILVQWSVDAYYRIVMAANDGVATIVRAMRAFAAHRGLQECGCLTLGNLCVAGSNLPAVESAGGVAAIIAAMKMHASSIAVQSAACDALRNMSGLVVLPDTVDELVQLLGQVKEMKLFPKHRHTAVELYNTFCQKGDR